MHQNWTVPCMSKNFGNNTFPRQKLYKHFKTKTLFVSLIFLIKMSSTFSEVDRLIY